MATSRISLPALVAAFIGGLVALHDTQGLLCSLAGLALLTALIAYDERGVRNGLQSLAYALVCGLAVLCAVSYPMRAVLSESSGFLGKESSPMAWVVATAVVWFIDRARMNARQSLSLRGGYGQPAANASYAAASQPNREQRTYAPPAPPQPVAEPEQSWNAPPEDVYQEQAHAEQVAAAAAPVPTGGKEVSIYVNMVGEGLNVLRPVRAEHLGRDFYIIVDDMPTDENWEYLPGQVVRCRKKNLSTGKGLVAYEEAPRAS